MARLGTSRFRVYGGSFVLSPDWKTIALLFPGGADLVELPAYRWHFRIPGARERTPRALFSPDGKVLALLEGGRISFWRLPVMTLIVAAAALKVPFIPRSTMRR